MKRPYEKPVLIPFGYLKYMRPHRSVGHPDEPIEHRYVTQERQRRVSGQATPLGQALKWVSGHFNV
jgi:hypothetical protein